MGKVFLKKVEDLILKFKEYYLISSKKKNKNVVVSKKIDKYIQDLATKDFSREFFLEYSKILSEENRNYQTPLSELSFLSFLIKISRSKKILEIGTFKGLTALCFALGAGDDGQVYSCEINSEYKKIAEERWKRFKKEKAIILLEGKAKDCLDKLINEGKRFDFIYIDADKSSYPDYYDMSLKLSHEGTVIAIDNSLWAGLVAEPKTNYSHARIINQLNEAVFYNKDLDAKTLIPAWDGLTIVRVNK